MKTTITTRRLPLALAAAALLTAAVALTGCASPGSDTTPAAMTEADHITISDSWVKSADTGSMSAAFGVLENSGDTDVNLVSVTSDASPEMQLHETVAAADGTMQMQQKDGGFVIPAGGTFTLEPGGNHLMLMDLQKPIVAGDSVTFTLTFSDGSTFAFTAPAKDFSGANETYNNGGMDGMDMGGTETNGDQG